MSAGRMLLVQDEDGTLIAVGALYRDESLDQAQRLASRAGHHNAGVVPVMSWQEYRDRARKRERQLQREHIKSIVDSAAVEASH